MRRFHSRGALTPIVCIVLLAACGAESSSKDQVDAATPADASTACAGLAVSPVALAVSDYITTAEPKPLRFLSAATTDSALPEAAERVVQDAGPTFYWLPGEKPQQQIREKLERDGDWATMLVVVREAREEPDGSQVIRIGGSYIGAPHEGVQSAEQRYVVTCATDSVPKWELTKGAGAQP